MYLSNNEPGQCSQYSDYDTGSTIGCSNPIRGGGGGGAKYLSLLQNVQTGSGTNPASHSMRAGGLKSTGGLQPRTEVKNEWRYTSGPPGVKWDFTCTFYTY